MKFPLLDYVEPLLEPRPDVLDVRYEPGPGCPPLLRAGVRGCARSWCPLEQRMVWECCLGIVFS
jgi:hypothetical protein